MKLKKRAQAGFTIIEMLIVVTILAMLTGILVPVLEDSQKAARDARRSADLKAVQASLEAYKRVNGQYPSTGGAWQGDAPSFGGLGYDATGYIPGLVPNFMQALPKDPDASIPVDDRGYFYRSDGDDYKFGAHKTPESFDAGNPFIDPSRPTTSWMVSTPGAYNW